MKMKSAVINWAEYILELVKSKEYNKLNTIGTPNRKRYIYKYTNVESAIRFLKSSNLCFVEPSVWNDPYEKRFYTADYSDIKGYSPPEKVYSTCVTKNKTSEAAWKIYSYDAKGLASRCVQIKFSRAQFLSDLNDFATKNNYRFFEGVVNYDYYNELIDNLHKNGEKGHDVYFTDFKESKYLNLLLIKRQAFAYEGEIRYFLIPNKPSAEDRIFIPFNCVKSILEILVDRNCSDFEMELITDTCKNAGLKIIPQKFDLYKSIGKIKIEP
jgi:hypothetical protein